MIDRRIYSRESTVIDTRGLGNIMMELMETETWIRGDGSLKLQHPEKWRNNHGIDSFLEETMNGDIERLKKASDSQKSNINGLTLVSTTSYLRNLYKKSALRNSFLSLRCLRSTTGKFILRTL